MTSPVVAATDLPLAGATEGLSLVDAPAASMTEETRWMAALGLPMLAACAFVALTIGVGSGWLMLPAIILVGVDILMIVYLALTSDTNA
jgi:hypothetical protein